ncbi:MAG: CCA tRNA nucleotidyltransferase [Deltaproteobacteria bacterium]|nr:CCA tRNA nucleotidyltransferase [Deltaproteobacteria bacterium]
MNPTLHVPRLVEELAKRCHDASGRALLVGGGVRDFLMDRKVKDWDVEVHGLSQQDLVPILNGLGRVNAVGRSFGVYKLCDDEAEVDVSLPRRDSKVGRGHRGIRVAGDPYMSPREAARRRDLTVNAIMQDVLTGEILDPWNGRSDLQSRTLRPVDPDTFLEDPLRALRVVQLASRLEFRPTPTLLALCREADLDELPAERLQEEWRKLLLSAHRPSLGLEVARTTMVLSRVFPEAAAADDPHVDAALDRVALRSIAPEGRRFAAMLATWLHLAEVASVEATLDRLWLHTWRRYPLRERVLQAVAHWREDPADDAALRHLSTRTELELTLTVRWAITEEAHALERLRRAAQLDEARAAAKRLRD